VGPLVRWRSIIASAYQLEGEPPAAGADLDDALHTIREPSNNGGMQALGRNKAVIKLGFKRIEELPGEIGSRCIAEPSISRLRRRR